MTLSLSRTTGICRPSISIGARRRSCRHRPAREQRFEPLAVSGASREQVSAGLRELAQAVVGAAVHSEHPRVLLEQLDRRQESLRAAGPSL